MRTPASKTCGKNACGLGVRHWAALGMLVCMAAVAEFSGEKEILFPEMAALTIGFWIVDKRVWRAGRLMTVILMTIGAVAGVCIVRYSPLPAIADVALAFSFAAVCLLLTRTTLIPLISACMLPVLLGTRSWVYPAAVLAMSLVLVAVQRIMVGCGLRKEVLYEPVETCTKKELLRWLGLLCTVVVVAALPVSRGNIYLILPPLIVTFVEFSCSGAGFRNRPMQVFCFLTVAAVLGSLFLYCGHTLLGLPKFLTVIPTFLCLFALFERRGKYFAPAAATAMVPLIIPPQDLLVFPFQVAAGAALFIALSMILFLRCYKWSRAQLAVALIPSGLRNMRRSR